MASWSHCSTPSAKKALWVANEPDEASKLKVVGNSFISALTPGAAEAVRLAAPAELFLRKFILSNNAVLNWHALRNLGIEGRLAGCGRIFHDL